MQRNEKLSNPGGCQQILDSKGMSMATLNLLDISGENSAVLLNSDPTCQM